MPKNIDLYYHRPGWMTCVRAREYLETNKVAIREEINSRAGAKTKKDALTLARRASRLVAARGTKITELDLSKKPKDAEILALMLGPTGNLRAPTIVKGKTIYVGFPRGGFPGLWTRDVAP